MYQAIEVVYRAGKIVPVKPVQSPTATPDLMVLQQGKPLALDDQGYSVVYLTLAGENHV